MYSEQGMWWIHWFLPQWLISFFVAFSRDQLQIIAPRKNYNLLADKVEMSLYAFIQWQSPIMIIIKTSALLTHCSWEATDLAWKLQNSPNHKRCTNTLNLVSLGFYFEQLGNSKTIYLLLLESYRIYITPTLCAALYIIKGDNTVTIWDV